MATIGLRLHGKYKILKLLVVYTVPILVSTGYEKFQLIQSFKSVGYSGRTNRFGFLGQPQSGHVMLSPFS